MQKFKKLFFSQFYLPLIILLFCIVLGGYVANIMHHADKLPIFELLYAKLGTFIGILIILAVSLIPFFFFDLNAEHRQYIPFCICVSVLILSLLTNSWFATLMIWITGLTVLIYYLFLKKTYKHPIFILLISIFLVRIIYFFFSSEPFSAIEQSLSFLIFPIIFFLMPIPKDVYKSLVKAGLYLYLGITLFMLIQVFVFANIQDYSWQDLLSQSKSLRNYYLGFPLLTHPTFFSLNISLTFALAFYIFTKEKWFWYSRIIVGLFLSLVILAMVFTGSRAGIVVAGMSLAAFICFQIPVRFWIQIVCFLALNLVSFLQIQKTPIELNDIYREQMIEQSKQMFCEKPIFGRGIAPLQMPVYNNESEEIPLYVFDTPHNQIYTDLVRFGFLGSLPLFLTILAIIFLAVYPQARYSLIFWLITYLPMMWIETPFESAAMVIPFVFWLCFFFSQEPFEWKGKFLFKSKNRLS